MGHSGQRPFGCVFCGYRSNEKGNVVRHVKCCHAERLVGVTSDREIPVSLDVDTGGGGRLLPFPGEDEARI